MNRITTLTALLAVVLGLGACMKVEQKFTFTNDNTATLSQSMSYSVETIETIIAMAGSQMPEDALEKLEGLESQVSEENVRKEMKEQGVEVTKFTASSKDGWKGFVVEAKVADVNAWLKKAGEGASEAMNEAGMDNPFGSAMDGLSPKFYKTDKQGVGRIVLLPAMKGAMADMPNPDDMSDEELDMADAQLQMMKSMFALDEMLIRMEVTLPGKVLSVTGGKKIEGKENSFRFEMKGTNFSIDGLSTMFGMKDGVSATFQIPEGCKITFQDEKKAEPKKTEEEAPSDEAKPKKGGLKVGGDK